ncbi:MAG TPA: DUF4175 family protein, partial [Vicinamibacterales bacterium]|nr:DUF4175 family protein [Vicinamibacterales bacterium]
LVVVGSKALGPARQAVDALSLALFPGLVALQVAPGNARIRVGTALEITAHLVGNNAPVIGQVQIANEESSRSEPAPDSHSNAAAAPGATSWRTTEMMADGSGGFRAQLESVTRPFKYRVLVGSVLSPIYAVTVALPPHVARIDVDYTYPPSLGLQPRTEKDSGDIYAPEGTNVRLHVFSDRPAAHVQMALTDGQPIGLSAVNDTEFAAALTVTADNSYRLSLNDREGLGTSDDTEYFIRVLEDRPPDVRITKPAADRSVTRLEEVDIDAQAEDDYGVDRLDLVYSVKGGAEKLVPLPIARGKTNVTGRQTIYLEDLGVQPGDFISYYVRARDLTKGTKAHEAKSDIYFLEVKPYEQEFAVAQSQATGGATGGTGSIDDLVAAQKEVVVATFKLDRRAQAAKGAKSESDIKSVSRAEGELKTRVEQTSSSFRESTMRDPRRRQPQRGRGGQPQPEPLKAGATLPEEDEMTSASAAMGKAVSTLDELNTSGALSPEMEALNHLLKAQADVKRREVTRQQAGFGNGGNRNLDVSALFDKELQKAQQTNYETRSGAEERQDSAESALDKIKALAQRQDELMKRQQELARKRDSMSEEELKRELETLTREQSELRQRAEDLARQMSGQSAASNDAANGSKDAAQPDSGRQGPNQQASDGRQSGQQRGQGSRGSQGERQEAN